MEELKKLMEAADAAEQKMNSIPKRLDDGRINVDYYYAKNEYEAAVKAIKSCMNRLTNNQ